MRSFFRFAAISLLIFVGTGALYGGYRLMAAPDGTAMHLPLNILAHTPFTDFFIPGLILFAVNGICSFFVLFMCLYSIDRYSWLITCQGVLLSGWILVQMVMLQQIVLLHFVMGLTGILLIVSGLVLYNLNIIRKRLCVQP